MVKQTLKLEWDAHEYEHKERSSDWYWAVGIVAVSAAIASIIFGNIIFALLVLLCVFSLTLHINRPPEVIQVTVSEHGITRDSTLYPYHSLHSFWVDEEHPHRKIILKSKKLLMPLIVIPLGDMDGDEVRDVLLEHLPEEYLTLPFLEKLLEYFGF